jgi:hypothetical protein
MYIVSNYWLKLNYLNYLWILNCSMVILTIILLPVLVTKLMNIM